MSAPAPAFAVPPGSFTLPQIVGKVGELTDEARAQTRLAVAADFTAWHTARHAAMRELTDRLTAELGAKVDPVRLGGTRVKIAGISATSTSGLIAALNNWCTAAERKSA